MGDTYIEQMVARKKSVVPTALYVILGSVAAGSVILGILGGSLFYSIALFAGLGIYFVHYLTGVEYEYLYVDKSFSVDKIVAKRTRKRVAYDSKIVIARVVDTMVKTNHDVATKTTE